jgi:hypothetical protein
MIAINHLNQRKSTPVHATLWDTFAVLQLSPGTRFLRVST